MSNTDFVPEEITFEKVNRSGERIYLNEEFERRVLLHIIGNSLDKPICPRFLAIEGAMGEGKSVQTLYSCLRNDIHTYYFSGAELSGELEAASRDKLEKTFDYLKHHRQKDEFYVIIIDDFHLSVSSTDEKTTNTINSQILTGYLMELADQAKIEKGMRIPIILIANDFEKLHSPLVRDGRMDFFRWEPNEEVKKNLIRKIFSKTIHKDEEKAFKGFINQHISEPVSFFSEILNEAYKYDILQVVASNKLGSMGEIVRNLNEKYKENISINVEFMKEIVEKRKMDKPLDYLKEKSNG